MNLLTNMAIKISKKEYESKFGQAPTLGESAPKETGQTFGGKLVRGILKPFVSTVTDLSNAARTAVGQQPQVTKSNYLGDVPGVGLSEGSFGHKLGEAALRGTEIAGTIPMGGAAVKGVVKGGEAIAEGTKPAIQATGRLLKKAGEEAYGVTVTPEEGTRLALQSYEAKQPRLMGRIKNFLKGEQVGEKPITEANTAARHGLAGTEWHLGVQAKQVSNDIWEKTIAPKLDAVKGAVNMKDFFGQVEKEISGVKELSRRNALKEGLDALREDFKSVGKISLRKLQEYKEGWAEHLPDAVYKGKPIAGALKEVKNLATKKAREIIYHYVGDEGKQAYIDYGNLKSIAKAGIKSISDPAKKSLSKNAWEFLMDKAITPVATFAGKVLYKTGEGLEFVGKQGARKVKDVINK